MAAAAFLAAACSGGSGERAAAPEHGLTEREVVTTLTFPPSGPRPPGTFDAVDSFPALSFDEPLVLTHAGDGSGRLFVAERAGRVLVFADEAAATSTETFLDLRDVVVTGSERGLLGLAFDPDHGRNGRLYVAYSTAAPPGSAGVDHRFHLSRFTVSPSDPDRVERASEEVLLALDQPRGNHNGGCVAFGPDGKLYLSVGDGGGGGDPYETAQDLGSLFGKVLRLETDGSAPRDNPFVGVAGARPEIWAFGLRNPWRMSFDRATGELWLADVGQNEVEEIDLVERGGNYGWDLFEGSRDYENPDGVPLSDTVAPVFEYAHPVGESITGGVVYRGTESPSLVGAYVHADYVSGRVWALVLEGDRVLARVPLATLTSPVSFGEDARGELHVLTRDGGIHRLVERDGGAAEPFPTRLSETGLFRDTAALRPAAGLIEYDVVAPLWSDGAAKRRWIALPGLDRIGFAEIGPWSFPRGTVLVKHFEADTTAGPLRLETRVLIHEEGGWRGYTYRWDASQGDAELLPGRATTRYEVADPDAPGGAREVEWTFPSRTDCLACHTSAAGRVLGVRTAQLNRSFAYPALEQNQLAAWDHVELFDQGLGDPATLPALADPADGSLDLARRARSYLDANCGLCHRPGGPTPVDLDLRWTTPAASMNAVGVAPTAGDLGIQGALLVAPGDKEASVLWERLRRLGPERMPPLGSGVVDEAAVELVGRWIDAGAP